MLAGDVEVMAALAVIAMRRSGQNVSEDFILDQDVEAVTLIGDELTEGGDPPA